MKRRWYASLFLAALVGLSGQRADAMRTPLADVRAAITQPHQLTAATAASDQPADAWIVESIIPLGTTADGQPLALISLLVPTAHLAEHTPTSTRAGPYPAPETHTRVFCIVQPPLGLELVAPGVWRVEAGENLWTIYNKARTVNGVQLTREQFMAGIAENSLDIADLDRIRKGQLIRFFSPDSVLLRGAQNMVRMSHDGAIQELAEMAAYESLSMDAPSSEFWQYVDNLGRINTKLSIGVQGSAAVAAVRLRGSPAPLRFKGLPFKDAGRFRGGTLIAQPWLRGLSLVGHTLSGVSVAIDIVNLSRGKQVGESLYDLGLIGLIYRSPTKVGLALFGVDVLIVKPGVRVLNRRIDIRQQEIEQRQNQQYDLTKHKLHLLADQKQTFVDYIDELWRPGGIIENQ